jgi:hypothetical protein
LVFSGVRFHTSNGPPPPPPLPPFPSPDMIAAAEDSLRFAMWAEQPTRRGGNATSQRKERAAASLTLHERGEAPLLLRACVRVCLSLQRPWIRWMLRRGRAEMELEEVGPGQPTSVQPMQPAQGGREVEPLSGCSNL